MGNRQTVDLYFRQNRHLRRRIVAHPVSASENIDPRTGINDPNTAGDPDSAPSGANQDMIEETPAYIVADNADPLKRRIWHYKRRDWLSKLIRYIIEFIRGRRVVTSAEKKKRSELAERKALRKLLKDESNLYMDRIVSALNRLNLCYRYPKSQRDLFVSGIQTVKFDTVVLQPEAIYLRINVRRIPRGVSLLALMDPNVLTDLSMACQRKVIGHYDERVGPFYVVERATGVRGVPIHVQYSDMVEDFPTSADELTIPLGMTTNSRKVYRSLKSMPHILVAGTTGGGKSNFLNVMLCSFIMRNGPESLQMILVDMKGGMEMGFYEDIPHLYPIAKIFDKLDGDFDLENGLVGGIVTDRELVPPILNWLMKECNRRMSVLREAGHKDIDKYNGKRKRKLPRILLLIDELAQIRLIRKIGTDVDELLSSIAAIGRAVGVHLVIATQTPKREVISTLIKANLPAKFATNCANNVQSELIIDNGNAAGLNVPGRGVYQCGEELLIQAPYISDGTIIDIVKSVRDGQAVEFRTHDVSLEEMLTWALDNQDGKLIIKVLYSKFSDRGIARDELNNWLKQLDNKTIDLRGSNYRIVPGAGTQPRRLIFEPVTQDEDQQQGDT